MKKQHIYLAAKIESDKVGEPDLIKAFRETLESTENLVYSHQECDSQNQSDDNLNGGQIKALVNADKICVLWFGDWENSRSIEYIMDIANALSIPIEFFKNRFSTYGLPDITPLKHLNRIVSI